LLKALVTHHLVGAAAGDDVSLAEQARRAASQEPASLTGKLREKVPESSKFSCS
jgi:hypothetical protein